MEINDLKTNKQLEDAGVVIPFGDATVTLRARNSEVVTKIAREIFKPHESSVQLNLLSQEKMQDLLNEVAAKAIIVDWSGFTSGGEPVPFSVETALEYLKVPRFRTFIDENTDKLENFREAKVQIDVKNS